MRITFVLSEADLSGGCRVIAIHAHHLHTLGHKVTVIARPNEKPNLREKMRWLIKGIPIAGRKREWPSYFDNLPIDFHKIDRFRPITAADVPDADVVIATWWETVEWVKHYPASKGAKAYFIQHFETHLGRDIQRIEDTWRQPFHKIVIAEWLGEVSRKQFKDADFSLVPNSVDFHQFHAPPRSKNAIPTVGVMYSQIPFKGADISIKAYQIAKRTIPNLRLVTFGNRAADATLQLPEGTSHTIQPAQDKIREIYSQCDAWLVASRSEGFGLPILEAMACRTPVIATPTGAAPELLRNGAGSIVPHEDVQAMAREIVRIASLPPADWLALSNRAHQVATSYSWDDAAHRFVSALEKAIQKSGQKIPAPVLQKNPL